MAEASGLTPDTDAGTRRRRARVYTHRSVSGIRLILSPPSLRHFVTQGLLPSVVVLGCGFSLPMCGFVIVRTFA